MTPKGWERRSVREFSERLKRINSDGLDLEPLSITKDRGVILQSEKYNKRIATDPRKYVFAEDGDFAFDPMSLYYGAIGRVGRIGRGLVSPDYVVFKADESVDGDFLHALLRYPEMHKLYESLSETGNTFGKRRRLYWSIFEEIELTLPPLGEQKKIAAILSSVDEAIESTQAVIDQLQVVKKAMLAELLNRGLPGRHTRFKQTEIGEVPEEWEVRRFDALCSKIVDGVHKKPEYAKSGIPFVTVRNLTAVDEGISFDNLNYVTESDHREFIKRAHPERGDVLLTKDGTLGVPRVIETDERFSIFVSVALLKPIRALINPWFMRFALEAPPIAGHFGIVNAGQALKHIHLVDLRATPCPIPPMEEQEEIAGSLRAVGERLRSERAVADGLRHLKSALMSVLLTGEVRVKPDDEAA